MKEADGNGIPVAWKARLGAMLEKYRDCFRTKLCADHPAKTRILEIQIKPNAKPRKASQRR